MPADFFQRWPISTTVFLPRGSRRLDQRSVPKVSPQEKQECIAYDIPRGSRVVGGAGAEATAINIQATRKVEQQGSEEHHKQQVRQDNRSRKPDAKDQKCPEDQLKPGQNESGKVDEVVGKDLIVADAFGKVQRMHDLVQAGKDENPTKDQPSRKAQEQVKRQAPI